MLKNLILALGYLLIVSCDGQLPLNENPISEPSTQKDTIDSVKPLAGPPLDEPVILVPNYTRAGGHRRAPKEEPWHFAPNSHKFWSLPEEATSYLLEGCMGDDCECDAGTQSCVPQPAYADIITSPDNFLWCKGGPFALCYYSGPDTGSTDLSCTLTPDGLYANCKCFEIDYGLYFVDILSILNWDVYEQTVAICGSTGSNCTGAKNINRAPVCEAINENKLIPGAELVSTFSFDCVQTNGLSQTNCAPSLYAGCMTAPCQRTTTPGIVECSCPTYNGPYQVGTALNNPEEECVLGDNLVWSAAFSPTGQSIPPADPCIPDAAGSAGCPLYSNSTTLPEGTDCRAICRAYGCLNQEGVEPAFTCDATLCTRQCNEMTLIADACNGLKECGIEGLALITELEQKASCSCCASQLCGCEPNAKTNDVIYDLNEKQRALSITPQCDVNGTLCGTPIKK